MKTPVIDSRVQTIVPFAVEVLRPQPPGQLGDEPFDLKNRIQGRCRGEVCLGGGDRGELHEASCAAGVSRSSIVHQQHYQQEQQGQVQACAA